MKVQQESKYIMKNKKGIFQNIDLYIYLKLGHGKHGLKIMPKIEGKSYLFLHFTFILILKSLF